MTPRLATFLRKNYNYICPTYTSTEKGAKALLEHHVLYSIRGDGTESNPVEVGFNFKAGFSPSIEELRDQLRREETVTVERRAGGFVIKGVEGIVVTRIKISRIWDALARRNHWQAKLEK